MSTRVWSFEQRSDHNYVLVLKRVMDEGPVHLVIFRRVQCNFNRMHVLLAIGNAWLHLNTGDTWLHHCDQTLGVVCS